MRGPAAWVVSCVILVALGSGAPAQAQATVDTAVVHIGVDTLGTYGIDNALNYLQGDSRFATVDSIDVDASGVPTAGQLAAYDSLLIVTDNRAGTLTGGGLGTQLGNVLDDYVNGGGRVVFSTFTGSTGIGVDGEILTLAPHTIVGGNASAGAMVIPPFGTHWVFDGVSSFSSNYASVIGTSGIGIVLASYASGTLGVLTVADDSVMFVNGFPADESDYSNGTDFGLLFANALAAQGAGTYPVPELDGIGIVVLVALLALAGAVLVSRGRIA